MKKENVRLSPYVKPSLYEVYIHTDVAAGTFTGTVCIYLSLKKKQRAIVLHAKELAFASVYIEQGKRKQIGVAVFDTKKETATCAFLNELTVGKATLVIEFSGTLNNSMRGFYKSSYEKDGVLHNIATTQFEATDARRAFPCFDEPEAKAVFSVTLSAPTGMAAISNGECMRRDIERVGYTVHHYGKTPKMSTYLLAFIIGDFEYIEGKTKRGLPVRVYTALGKKKEAKFALSTGIAALDFYETYFATPYPMSKLDMIAIPDFESGAMENWGAVTYRETALLVNEKTTSAAAREWVALVIAHELAHQWFGNLVTMEWWTDLWLNEGFASYIEYVAVDTLFPEWNIWECFVVSDLDTALSLDALQNTHPIEVVVHHPDEIGEIFDAISYSKGASVIRMLAEYLGEKNFRNGLRAYLKKHTYANTVTTDLWKSLAEISGLPVEKMMKGWTRQAGHPIVTVEKHKRGVVLSQERFYSSTTTKHSDATLWNIPVSIVTPHGIVKKIITKKKEVVEVPFSEVLKLNSGETGVYRNMYDRERLHAVRPLLEGGLLSVSDRIGIARDLGALVEKGEVLVSEYLEFISVLRKETDYNVWVSILSTCGYIRNIFWELEERHAYDVFVRDLLSEIVVFAKTVESKNETHGQKLLRPFVLSVSASYGDTSVIALAKKLWKEKDIPANLRSYVYTTVVREGSVQEYREMKTLYKKETSSEEKGRLLRGLMSARTASLVEENIKFIYSEEVRAQDFTSAFSALMANHTSREHAYIFMKEQWGSLYEKYKGGHSLTYIVGALEVFSDTAVHRDIKTFFTKKPKDGYDRTLLQTLETIEGRIYCKKVQKKSFEHFLKKAYK